MQRLGEVSAGEGRTRVHATIYEVGDDLLVILGGEGAHLGAASLAEGSPDDRGRPVHLSAPGHREVELTDRVSCEVAAATGRRTLAVAGIHLDRIRRDEIEAVRANARALIPRLVDAGARSADSGA